MGPTAGAPISRADESKDDLIARAIETCERGRSAEGDAQFLRGTTGTWPPRTSSGATPSTSRVPRSRTGRSPRPGPRHRSRARLHPDRRGARLGVGPHRRRDRHRRHAVPRRLGHQLPRPASGAPSTSSSTRSSSVAVTSPAQLLEVLDDVAAPSRIRPDAVVESWMHVEIDRETDTDDLVALEADLRRRAARRPRGRRGLAEDARGRAAHRRRARRRPAAAARRARSSEAWSCCAGWPTTTSPSSATASTSWSTARRRRASLARGARHRARHPALGRARLSAVARARCLPGEVRAKAREPQLLVLTKANSRSTVHRAGLPRLRRRQAFDARRQRSSASTASSACSRRRPTRRAPLRRSRCCGARSRAVLERAGFPPRQPQRQGPAARSSRPTRATSCSRSTSTSCFDDRDRHPAPAGAAPAPAVRAPRRRTAASCRASSTCRATATPPHVRLEMQRDPASTRSGRSRVDYTARVSESVLARLHFVVRVPGPACVRATSTDAELEAAARRRDPRPGPTTSPTRWSTALGEETGVRPAAPLRRRVPRGVPGGLRRRAPPSPTCAARGARATTATSRSTCTSRSAPARRAPRSSSTGSARRSSLSEVLPLLQHMGVEVVDERPYEIERRGREPRLDLRLRPALRRPASDARRRRAASASRTRSPRPGAGDAENDGFNPLVLRAGLTWRQVDGAARVRQVPAPGRDAVQPGRTSSRRLAPARPHRPAAGRAVRGPLRPRRHRRDRAELTDRHRRRGARPARSTRSPASTRTASCARSCASITRHAAHQLLPARRRRRAPPVRRVQARPAADPRPAARRGRCSRSSCTRRASRACTCASARSRAAASAGRTGARTSAPRCSA